MNNKIKEESLSCFVEEIEREKVKAATADLHAAYAKLHEKKTQIEILEQRLEEERVALEKIEKAFESFKNHRKLDVFMSEV